MATGQVITDSGRKIVLNRAFKAVPNYKVITHFKVGTSTTTPAATQTDLVSPVAISGATLTKDFVAGYPSLDETTMQVTTRCILLTTEPTTQPVSLNEFGTFNEDATPLMYGRIVHTPITKTTSVQVVYVQKDKIVTE